MIHTGLDWSGTPGDVQGEWVVFAAVHVAEAEAPLLEAELLAAKSRLRQPADFVFSHGGASARTVREVFDAMARSPVTAHVHMLHKPGWVSQQPANWKGSQMLLHGIVTVVVGCPSHVVGKQKLYIDLSDDYASVIGEYRTAIRKALRGTHPRRSGFSDVRPCPDHRVHGGIIQVADMLAGEVRAQAGLHGPALARVAGKVTLV